MGKRGRSEVGVDWWFWEAMWFRLLFRTTVKRNILVSGNILKAFLQINGLV